MGEGGCVQQTVEFETGGPKPFPLSSAPFTTSLSCSFSVADTILPLLLRRTVPDIGTDVSVVVISLCALYYVGVDLNGYHHSSTRITVLCLPVCLPVSVCNSVSLFLLNIITVVLSNGYNHPSAELKLKCQNSSVFHMRNRCHLLQSPHPITHPTPKHTLSPHASPRPRCPTRGPFLQIAPRLPPRFAG